ncbi:MAG TPA: hypothetical protein ENK43_11680 [Planctomycetes bacterium]|nr:hypothetical protein [Planctomycetota bacterium]
MWGRYSFWLLLAACVVVAAAVWGLNVKKNVAELKREAENLAELEKEAQRTAAVGIGPATLKSFEAAQEELWGKLRALEDRFLAIDEDNLDHWFDGLDLDWRKLPKPEAFRRQFALARDQQIREVNTLLKERGFDGALYSPPAPVWLTADKLPKAKALKRIQRAFWIEDRIVRALARFGAVLSGAVEGGEQESEMGSDPAGGLFDRIRYTVKVHCPADQVLNTAHAFDRPFEVTHEGGEKETMSLPFVVDNISIKRLALDSVTANRYKGTPPVEVDFFLTVLDFRPERARAGR